MTALAAHYTPEHQMFRDTCRRFFEKEVTPFHMKWEEEGVVPRELWRKAGEQGLLGMTMPEEYGGAGADFLYSAILIEEQGRALASGPAFSLHNDIVVPYLLHYGTEEQKKKWIPKACSGELVTAIAMTEPGTGSDLQAVKTTAVMDGNHWVINGSKTFISNGQLADLVIVVAKTDPKLGAKGTSLIAVETHDRGLQARPQSREDRHEGAGHVGAVLRGRARAGRSICWAGPAWASSQLMQQLPQERLVIAIQAVAAIEAALEHTLAYVKERKAFGKQIIDFQNTRFKLAELKTKAHVAARVRRRLRRAASQGRARRRDRRHGQVLDHRPAVRADRRVPAVPRRLRLHVGIPDRAPLRRRARAEDLRRHQRDHEGTDRTHALIRIPRHRGGAQRRLERATERVMTPPPLRGAPQLMARDVRRRRRP